MPDASPDDPKQAILNELESIAQQGEARQAAWLQGIASRFAGHPQRDQIVEKFRTALGAMKQMQEARLGLARAEELLEADSVAKLESVLGGAARLPSDERELLRFLLYITMAGHFLPNVRSRLEEADAQAFLRTHFAELFSRGGPRAGQDSGK